MTSVIVAGVAMLSPRSAIRTDMPDTAILRYAALAVACLGRHGEFWDKMEMSRALV